MSLNPVGNDECTEYYPPNRKLNVGLTSQQMCAKDLEGIQDTCLGDSGGPLQVKVLGNDRLTPFLVGVTSFGKGCGTETPGVYVRLSEYVDWIEQVTDVTFQPQECIWKYVEYREYDPDILVDKSSNGKFEYLDFTKKHIENRPDRIDHIAKVGWTLDEDDVSWDCGATFITELYLLTAASCISARRSVKFSRPLHDKL